MPDDPPLASGARMIGFVGVTDPRRALTFYRDTLGLHLVRQDGFALVFNVQGAMLRAAIVPSVQPAPYTVLGWEVTDVARTAQALRDAGVALERFPGMNQDALGIWTSPDGSKVAWFRDPDGNMLSVSQHARITA